MEWYGWVVLAQALLIVYLWWVGGVAWCLWAEEHGKYRLTRVGRVIILVGWPGMGLVAGWGEVKDFFSGVKAALRARGKS